MGGMGSVVGGMVGSVGVMDVGCKFFYDGVILFNEGLRLMFVLVMYYIVFVVSIFLFCS